MFHGFSQEVKEQVRQATDIVDLVGSYLELRRLGRNFVARCPWHDDRRPSLNVNPVRQSWRCWVCNIGGDVFEFVMRKERVEFPEALRILADRAGIQLAKSAPTTAPGSPDDKATLYQAMAWAERLFAECLAKSAEGEAARQYLVERGISAASIERFRLGYSPDNWQWLFDRSRATSFQPEVLEACGLVGRSQTTGKPYDRFRGRLIFPIHDLQGRAIAFGGRVLPGMSGEQLAKYVNSPESRLFTKSDQLYALDLARDAVVKRRALVVVEGYTDVVLAHQCGVENVVAVLGTAINSRHLKQLQRFADTVYLVLDGDVAGQRRTNEVLELFVAEQMDLRILTLPDGMDPADFFLQRGADEFQALLGTAVDALEHRIRVSTQGLNRAVDTHRANRALDEIVTTIARAPRATGVPSADRVFREQQILVRLAREFSVDEALLRARVQELRTQQRPRPAAEGPVAVPEAVLPPIPLRSLPADEVELLEIAVSSPELAASMFARVGTEDLTAAPVRLLFNSLKFLCEQGEPLDFNHVLTELDDARLKCLLVEIDEAARAKAEVTTMPADSRLDQLCTRLGARRLERQRREAQAALEQGKLGFHKEMETLQKLFVMEKDRRGLSAPTEG